MTTPNFGECAEQPELSFIAGENKMVQPLWKIVLQFLKKVNIALSQDPIIVFHGIYPKKSKLYVHTKPFTLIFIAASFMITKRWKQPRCSLAVNELVNCDAFSHRRNLNACY